jgi:hypothetical protein
MPNRLIRDDLLKSDRWLGLAHPAERLAFVVLALQCDDAGCVEASDGALVRLWRDSCNIKGREDAVRVLAALVDADLVRPYDVSGKRYLFLPRTRWRLRSPRLKHPSPPECLMADEPDLVNYFRKINKLPPEMSAGCGDSPQIAAKDRPVVVEVVVENAVEGVGDKAKRGRFTPPTVDEVRGYMEAEGIRSFDPRRFVDHYEANGWMRGKTRMSNWKAAVRTWDGKRGSEGRAPGDLGFTYVTGEK